MSLKEEFKSKMKNLSEAYRAVKADLDALEAREKLVQKAIEFQDYKFKVSVYYGIHDKMSEVTPEDLPYIEWSGGSPMLHLGNDNSYLLVKNQADLDWHRKIYEAQKLVQDIQAPCPGGRSKEDDVKAKQAAMHKLYGMLK